MCITFFRLSPNSPVTFMIAFNRDQNAQRKTLPFGQFQDDPNIYAGRDLQKGGTWLGINIKTGIMVVLTNYRLLIARNGKSRGLLVKKFLQTDYVKNMQNKNSPEQISAQIQKDMTQILKNPKQYSAFNISVFNIRDNKIFYMCSQTKMTKPQILKQNIVHGYSNTDINTNWSKVQKGRTMFQKLWQQMEKAQQQNKQFTNQQIFQRMQKIMKDKQSYKLGFFQNFQSSIFISHYYSLMLRCYRMTKSTFYAIFRIDQQEKQKQKQSGNQNMPQKQDYFGKKIKLEIKQVSYQASNQESEVHFTFSI